LASRQKPSSGLTSSVGRQYVKACPYPRMDKLLQLVAPLVLIHVVGLPDPYGLPYDPASFVRFSINHLGILPVYLMSSVQVLVLESWHQQSGGGWRT